MNQDSKLASKIKAKATRFASKLSAGCKAVTGRFMQEMLLGIQAAKDVKVSEIARALGEETGLLSTEIRLCRRLAAEDLSDRINRRIVWEGAGSVTQTTVLALDLGDLRKRYAKRMENLADVRDGSAGEIARGYWLCGVVAAHPYGDKVTPLYGELYSAEAEDFESENRQMFRAIEAVREATEGRGIYAIDRGGDRWELLNFLLNRGLRFVIRQRGDRHLLLEGDRPRRASAVRHWNRAEETHTVEIERDGGRERLKLVTRVYAVRLPRRPDEALWLVEIEGFGEEPTLLLTNEPPPEDRSHGQWILEVYLTRWKVEESYRFLKQAYRLEDVRVRSYVALRNIYALAHAVFYFVSVALGESARMNLLVKKVCEKAKRFYEVATFYQYAVADGIHKILFARPLAVSPPAPQPKDRQLVFEFARPPD